MRILFTVSYYHPYVSGLTIAAARWAEGLATRGDDVTVLTMRHDRSLPERETIRGVAVERAAWVAKVSKGYLSWEWLMKSAQLTERCDAVVINLPQFEGLVPALLAKLKGKRVVALYHCEVVLPAGFVNGIVASFLEVSNFMTMLCSDAVVTYTPDYARASRLLGLLKRYRPDIPVDTVIPPIPMPTADARRTATLRRKIGNTDIVIGVAARLAAEKGIEHLIRAVPEISKTLGKRVRVAVAGPMAPAGEEAYRRRMQDLVRTHRKSLVFLGEIAPSDMGSFYRCIDLLALPSVNSTEAFGMVQVEAMRMGKPVVASDLPGVRVPVRETGMGALATPGDAHSIARAVSAVVRGYGSYAGKKPAVARAFPAAASVSALRLLLAPVIP